MMYRVVSYDRTTERMNGSLVIPPSVLARVKGIAGFQPQDDDLGEYSLNEEQTRQAANILGFRAESEKFCYQIEPYDPLDDSGFQEQTISANADEQ
jgi:hypothetical protein